MNVKGKLKAIGAVALRNKSWIATIGGMICIAGGTAVIISKAREATEVAEELEIKSCRIHMKDDRDEWESKKERSAARIDLLKSAVAGYSRTYWFGILLQLVGMGLITWSDVAQCKEVSQMSALASAYAATLGTIKERVIAEQGEEKWQEYLLGPQFTTVDVMPDGTIIQTTEPIDNPNRGANLPPHCFFFDEANPNWEKDPLANRDFLECHLRWLNQKLWAEGFLFENDIRRELGAPLVKSGWTSGIFAEDKDGNRNYISFGLDAPNPAAQRFRDGIEPSIVIQLNVEDNIIDQIQLPLI